jgi:uncharacterized protein (TIGR02453 family)
MERVIEQLAMDLPTFAPGLIATPKASIYRIHRDTRFSPDKTPFKTHVSAVFPHRRLTKHGGAGLYFHVATDHVMIGAGIYAPEPRQLYQLRQHVSANLNRFRTIVESPAFLRGFGEIGGKRLKRSPKGFAADDPAAEYLKLRQFLASTERPPDFATRPRFYSSLKRLFEQLAPFVRFLNESLTDGRKRHLDRLSSV